MHSNIPIWDCSGSRESLLEPEVLCKESMSATQYLSCPHSTGPSVSSTASGRARTWHLSVFLAWQHTSTAVLAPDKHLQLVSLQEQQYELQSLLRLAQSIDEQGASPDSGFRHLVLQQGIPQNLAGYVVQSFRAAPAAPADGASAQEPPEAQVGNICRMMSRQTAQSHVTAVTGRHSCGRGQPAAGPCPARSSSGVPALTVFLLLLIPVMLG